MNYYDLSDVFAMSETVESVLERSVRDEKAAADFINAVMAEPAHFQNVASAKVYQRKDAVVKYLQCFVQSHATLGADKCVALLFRNIDQRFWPADTPTLDLADIQRVFQAVDGLFPYSEKVFDRHSLVIMLHDGQAENCNAESTATFDKSGMRGTIRIYRMRESQGSFTATHVFLHKLGHLLHMRGTKTIKDMPESFPRFLRSIGADVKTLSSAQLLALFADTFLIVVISQANGLGDPFPEIKQDVKQLCFSYMEHFISELM